MLLSEWSRVLSVCGVDLHEPDQGCIRLSHRDTEVDQVL